MLLSYSEINCKIYQLLRLNKLIYFCTSKDIEVLVEHGNLPVLPVFLLNLSGNTETCCSGDPKTGHSNNGNIWITDFTIASSPCPIKYRASEYRTISPLFRWWSENWTICPVFRCPVTVCYSDIDLNTRQFVRYSDHGLNTGPFNVRTGLNPSNTELVRYLDPHYPILPYSLPSNGHF